MNEKKVNRSFLLEFVQGEINGYVVRAEKLKKPLDELYDWRVDIVSEDFDATHVKILSLGDKLLDLHPLLNTNDFNM